MSSGERLAQAARMGLLPGVEVEARGLGSPHWVVVGQVHYVNEDGVWLFRTGDRRHPFFFPWAGATIQVWPNGMPVSAQFPPGNSDLP